jgi:tryptophan synthase beta chain
MQGFKLLCQLEGIIPALESSHAIGHVMKLAPQMAKDQIILVNVSGRGDKDLNTVMQVLQA